MSHFRDIASEKIFKVLGSLFVVLLSVLMFRAFFDGSYVRDARVLNGVPEILFENEMGIWLPTTWSEYYWFQFRPYFFGLIGLVVISIGLWNRWEVSKSHDRNSYGE